MAGTAAYMMNVYSTALATIGVRSVRPSSLSKHGRSGALLSVGRGGRSRQLGGANVLLTDPAPARSPTRGAARVPP
eukprot:COSAG01_NODE_1297_length_10848_cov_60.004279_10_plen_76_part_00